MIISITKLATGFLVALKLIPKVKASGTSNKIQVIAGLLANKVITCVLKTVIVK